jgi:proton-coupled amino acid transporter
VREVSVLQSLTSSRHTSFTPSLTDADSVAILLSTPLQLFPAVRIMENGLFSKSGKHNPSVKWQKNVFRGAVVVFCSLLSWAGSSELDKFVALVGSFAW